MDTPLDLNQTYPKGFLDFLTLTPQRGHRVGDYTLQEAGLACFNAALAALSPQSPRLTLDQFATAAQRAIDKYPDGRQPAFVGSRLAALERLGGLATDAGWDVPPELPGRLAVVQDYLSHPDRLVPDRVAVVGRLDVAVLVDVLLQLQREDLADYEDFCRFRKVAADYAGIPVEDTGLTRAQWLEARVQANESATRRYGRTRARYVPDPRASLFHVT